MQTHLYRVGQMVDFHPSQRVGVTMTAREYKVLRLLPVDCGERMYRIKTIAEPFERIARESELACQEAR